MNEQDIQKAYEALGYQMGWAFLITPEARLRDAKVAIVGLNPGGNSGGAAWDCADGNAFFVQRWARNDTEYNRIQIQVQALHKALNVAADETLIAEYIPFRSPSWAALTHKEEALSFARELWTWVLRETPARIFICMGRLVAEELVQLTNARWAEELPTGWGNMKMHRHVAPDGRIIIHLPHPSHYLLFGRAEDRSLQAEESLRRAIKQPA